MSSFAYAFFLLSSNTMVLSFGVSKALALFVGLAFPTYVWFPLKEKEKRE